MDCDRFETTMKDFQGLLMLSGMNSFITECLLYRMEFSMKKEVEINSRFSDMV